MENSDSRTSSKLAGHIWSLKDRGVHDFEVTWEIFSVTIKCMLCLKEKHFIMYGEGTSSLNKRSEIFNTCRHRIKGLLVNN